MERIYARCKDWILSLKRRLPLDRMSLFRGGCFSLFPYKNIPVCQTSRHFPIRNHKSTFQLSCFGKLVVAMFFDVKYCPCRKIYKYRYFVFLFSFKKSQRTTRDHWNFAIERSETFSWTHRNCWYALLLVTTNHQVASVLQAVSTNPVNRLATCPYNEHNLSFQHSGRQLFLYFNK
jgi:hypothetical protein